MQFNQQKHQEQQQQYQQQREQQFQQHAEQQAKKKKRTWLLAVLISLIVVIGGVGYAGYYFLTPGSYDDFAKCLTDKGAVMYGAIKWCQYTQGQANMFGKSFKYVNYKDESQLSGIRTRPTWVINGQWHEKVQSFETLGAITGCAIG
ncbi:hypothetical protein HYX14_02250 [Candidatus Woesearchaeota archaeon]|nr:hypothetical protein [Candidatus Woesearchaeota archaeon]